LIDVTRRDLNNIIYKVYTRKKSYGKKAKELFSVFMAVAKQDNLIVNNPAYNLKSPRYEKKKFYPIRIEKLKELLVAASDTPTYLEILLGLMMGLRKGEIYGIKIEDINIKAQLLHVSQQVTYECEYDELTLISREQTEKDLKTENSERTLYIPDLIMAEIHNRLNRIEKDKLQKGKAYEDNHYLCGQRNGKPRAGGCLNIALNKLTAKVGVPKMAFHYLRHMTVTILLYLGFDLKTISKILGHASIKTTLMHYATDWDGEEDINRVFNRLISMTFGDAPYSTGVEMTGGAV
jgi:integrase